MILACLITITLHGGAEEQRIATCDLKKTLADYYVVDCENALSTIPGLEGQYSNYLIISDRCVAKEYQPNSNKRK